MKPEDQDHRQFETMQIKATLAVRKREIEAGLFCPRCFVPFDVPQGSPTVHNECCRGWSDERLERHGEKRYAPNI